MENFNKKTPEEVEADRLAAAERAKEFALELDSTEGELSLRQELFAKIYASNEEFFGNGVKSYIKAYGWGDVGPSGYASAQACASRLLRNPKIYRRINELLELDGLNDQAVDKQLLAVIAQHEDRPSKVAAIKEYNRVKARVVERRKVEHDVSPEAAEMARAAIESYFKNNATNRHDTPGNKPASGVERLG